MEATITMGFDLYARTAKALTTDTGSLNQPTDALVVAVITGTFTQALTTKVADLALDGSGSSSDLDDKTLAVGPQDDVIDPVTKDCGVRIIPPAGGIKFELTSDLPDPCVVHGFAVLSSDKTKLFGLAKLLSPQSVQYTGEYVSCPDFVIPIPRSAF